MKKPLKNFTFLFFCLILFFSCKKEQNITPPISTYDTISPKSYFPAYPGSWWKYIVNGTDVVFDTTSSSYLMNYYVKNRYWDSTAHLIPVYSDTCYVPYFNSIPVYGYEKLVWVRPPFGDYYTKWPVLSETIGFTFDRDWTDKRYGDFAEKVVVKDKFFNGTDSILKLESHWVYGPNTAQKRFQQWGKGIGLMNDYIIDTISSDTLYSKILTDHFINH